MIGVRPTNRTESKQLKRYLKRINCHWSSGGSLDIEANNYKTFKNQTVYLLRKRDIIITNFKRAKKICPVYTQNEFMKAAIFNKADGVIHCPTKDDNLDFAKNVNKHLELEPPLRYKYYREKYSGLLCYRPLSTNCILANSIMFYNFEAFNIVNYKLLKVIANMNNLNIVKYMLRL